MGKMQREKGYRFENETVNKFKAAGIQAERQPLSGALANRAFKNDLRAVLPTGKVLSIECKRRKNFSEYKLLEGTEQHCREEVTALVKRADRKRAVISLYLDDFLKFVMQR